MQRKLKTNAKIYAHIMGQLFIAQQMGGRLETMQRGARHLSFGVRLADPQKMDAAIKLAEPLALQSRVENILAQRVNGLIVYQIELQNSFWQTYTRGDLTGLGVGLAEARQPVEFRFDDAPHAMFAGTSGSGKTEAIKTALIALLTTYTPAELDLAIIDQKAEFAAIDNEAHLVAKRAVTDSEAANILQWADNELKRRIDSGQSNFKRLLIVIDEASLLPIGGKNNPNLKALQNLAKLGRSKKIHLILGDQKPGQTQLPLVTDNLINRFVGLVGNAHTSSMLTGQAGLEAHKLTGRGDFLHVVGARVERFQVALSGPEDFNALGRLHTAPATPLVIDGVAERLPDSPPPRGGKPPLTVTPAALAFYMRRKLTVRGAKNVLGFSQKRDSLYKAFLADLKKYYNLPEDKLLAVVRGE